MLDDLFFFVFLYTILLVTTVGAAHDAQLDLIE